MGTIRTTAPQRVDARDSDLSPGDLHVKPDVRALGAVWPRAATSVIRQLCRIAAPYGGRWGYALNSWHVHAAHLGGGTYLSGTGPHPRV